MGKRIISQARGHGSNTYRVRRKAYSIRIGYPNKDGTAKIMKIVHNAGHSAPLIKLQMNKEIFYIPAFQNSYEGQEINVGKSEEIKQGDILRLKDMKQGTKVYNIETVPGDGGKLIRTGGSFAEVAKKDGKQVFLLMPSKKTIGLNESCRATVGTIAGSGRLDKPMRKAGVRFHAMKAKGRKWHYTSAVKMNAVDHPFGGGRGKRIKSKIAKRNAPPGAKVGHIRPRRTGHKR
jgi:large subunit ribosomal protein L2